MLKDSSPLGDAFIFELVAEDGLNATRVYQVATCCDVVKASNLEG